MNEDWTLLMSFFPDNWNELAIKTRAIKGLRKHKDAENYLRTLMIHLACGHSMRETVARAKLANLADISDVALLGRLQKSKAWLRAMCLQLFQENGVNAGHDGDFQVRLFDATNVREPGKTGSLWRIHYSIQLPSLACDFFKLTPTKGKGNGESFFQYTIKEGDYIIADRGYSTAPGVHHVVSKKAYVTVRVNTTSFPVLDLEGLAFPLFDKVTAIKNTGEIKSWSVLIPNRKGETVKGRICVIRKSEEAIKIAHKKLKTNASKKGTKLKPETLEYAKYIILFTNFPQEAFSDVEVLEWYRVRWQVELVFKRFKSIAGLGHLPKYNDESSKAWLYGKLFVALLTEKLIRYASSVSPWGYLVEGNEISERLA